MEKIITWENLRNFAYCNDGVCQKPIRGIVISFFGLGSTAMFQEDTEEAIFYGENGILYLVPYNNPWAWMNPQAVAYTDELVDVLFAHYGLTMNARQYVLIGSTMRAYLTWLQSRGLVDCFFEDNRMYWRQC